MALIIVGLGNPGKEYEKTRHNAGRMAVALFGKQHEFEEFAFKKTQNALIASGEAAGEKVTLVLPETMMNLSGKSLQTLVKSPRAAKNLIVVRDDLDLPLGTIKMTFGRGSGGHKGVESIMRLLKTDQFTQVKIGISPEGKKHTAKKPSGEEKVVKHVIGKFAPKEEAALKKALKKTVHALTVFVEEGIEKAMMEANTK